jgi:hypothetical protein
LFAGVGVVFTRAVKGKQGSGCLGWILQQSSWFEIYST